MIMKMRSRGGGGLMVIKEKILYYVGDITIRRAFNLKKIGKKNSPPLL